MYLLVDIGNTAVKLAITNNHKIIRKIILTSDKVIKVKQLIKILQDNVSSIKIVALSSVKPIWNQTIKKLAHALKVPFYQVKNNLHINDFKININNPTRLGSDILMSAYGGFKKYINQDVIIVSFGTATTISMIKQNVFEGAIIMPGLKISAKALFANAALLKTFDYKYCDKVIGKNTEQAINLGVVNGHLYGVEGLISNLKKQLHNPLILITGGNNYHYESFFKNYKLEPDLLFIGMQFALANI